MAGFHEKEGLMLCVVCKVLTQTVPARLFPSPFDVAASPPPHSHSPLGTAVHKEFGDTFAGNG